MSDKEKNLARLLDNLCVYLDDTFNINAGGCCFVASVIAHCLEQDELDYKVGVCTEVDDYNEFNEIGCESQNHYFIVLDDVSINQDGENNYQIFDDVTSKDLHDHYMECDWNPSYNNTSNDFIEHIIKEFYVKFYETIYKRESDCICL